MINEADLVVIGEYEGLDSKWNMARNPSNPSEEDKEITLKDIYIISTFPKQLKV